MGNIIEVQSLEKVFANQPALEDVNFYVKKGEIFGFLVRVVREKRQLLKY